MAERKQLWSGNTWQIAFDFFNQELFENALPKDWIVTEGKTSLLMTKPGYSAYDRFVDKEGVLTKSFPIDSRYFDGSHNLLSVLENVAHNMCHLWRLFFGSGNLLKRQCNIKLNGKDMKLINRRNCHDEEWGERMEGINLPAYYHENAMKHRVEEGGNFEEACKRLLEDKYKIPWEARSVKVTKEMSQLSDLRKNLGIEELEEPEQEQYTNDDAADDGTYVEFVCPGCRVIASFKSSSVVFCNDCEKHFEIKR